VGGCWKLIPWTVTAQTDPAISRARFSYRANPSGTTIERRGAQRAGCHLCSPLRVRSRACIVGVAVRRRLLTSVEIGAPAHRVWEVLTDFRRYPQWNPYITRLHGDLAPAQRITVTTPPVWRRPRTFRPRVTQLERGTEFRWEGIIGSPAVFRGEHFFVLEALGPGRTRLLHGEDFSGALVPLHALSRYRSTKRGFERMNHALKTRLETPAP
jgi:hypothetical protein